MIRKFLFSCIAGLGVFGLLGVSGCPKTGNGPVISNFPVDPAIALQGAAALADLGQATAKARGDRVQCATFGVVSFAARIGSAVLLDNKTLPAGHLDISGCLIDTTKPLTCTESATATAAVTWGAAVGTALLSEASAPDGVLDWPELTISQCDAVPAVVPEVIPEVAPVP